MKKVLTDSVNKVKKILPSGKKQKPQKIIITVLVVLVLALAVYKFKDWVVVAVVNNRPVTRFTLDRQLEKQYGQQTLESEVSKILILQQAKKEGIEVSAEAIGEKVKEIEDQVTSQGADLETLLSAQGQTRADLEEQIRIQLIVEEILGPEVEVTQEEVAGYYETNQEFFPEGSTLEDLQERISQDLYQQKLAEAFAPWLEKVKGQSKIFYWAQF